MSITLAGSGGGGGVELTSDGNFLPLLESNFGMNRIFSWPAMYGVVCLSILLEGGVTVSNNFTKRPQNMALKSAQERSSRHI